MVKTQVKLIHWTDSQFSFKKQPVLSVGIVPKTIFFCDRLLLFHLYFSLGRGNSSTARISEEKQSVSKVLTQVRQTVILNNKSELLQSVELQCLQWDRTLKTSGFNPAGKLESSGEATSFEEQQQHSWEASLSSDKKTGPKGISKILQRQKLL